MKRLLAAASVAALVILAVILHTALKNFLWSHPWFHSALVALPSLALGYIELRHAGEANRLGADANRLRAEANDLELRNAKLVAEIDAERNRHLQRIADNTERPVSQADKNAAVLRRYLRRCAFVSEGQGNWGNCPEIVEVADNIVTLFTPYGSTSSVAWFAQVRCEDIEISEVAYGSCPVRLKILKRYGQNAVHLGQISKWEDRLREPARPAFPRGGAAYSATYTKPGAPERRSLFVYASSEGVNSFLLEASTGESATGDNVEISKRFMLLQIEYYASGFHRSTAGGGGGQFPLFVC